MENDNSDTIITLVEPLIGAAIAGRGGEVNDRQLLGSIAISVKRIADALEQVIDNGRTEEWGPAVRTQPGTARG